MDAIMAERLAQSMDPKALSSLQNRHSDPAVGRAVAAQFGSFLMQGMMQNADGGAMSVADGTGGAAVSSMFASAMGRFAMSGDKLGLADTIYRSMAAKGAPAPAEGETQPATSSAPAPDGKGLLHGNGISLAPYRQDRGHRPIGASGNQFTQPAGLRTLGKTSPNGEVTVRHEPATAALKKPAAPALPLSTPSAPIVPVANAASPANTPTPDTVPRARWTGISLPAQAHVLLPPAEPALPVAPAAVSAQAAAPPIVTTPGTGSASSGLPPAHPKGDTETAVPPPPHTAAATGGHGTALADAENFAEELAPAIEHAAAKLGVSPRILLAQAALETGWGHSVVGNNVFGVKAGASWSGTTVTAATHEMTGGHLVAHSGTFRAYANVGQAVDDYATLVSASSRYRAAMGSGDDAAAYAHALAAGGYASDRDYAAKLVAVANSPKMSYAIASLDEVAPGQLVSAHG